MSTPQKSAPVYIYIPGLGDKLTIARRLLIKIFWGRRRVKVFDSHWEDTTESAKEKQERLRQFIKNENTDRIVFIGESAGGSLAILMALQYGSLASFVTVCGYNHGQSSINKAHIDLHPAFYDLVGLNDKLLPDMKRSLADRSRVVYSLDDRLVEAKHSRISGVPEEALLGLSHNRAIIRCLTEPDLLGL